LSLGIAEISHRYCQGRVATHDDFTISTAQWIFCKLSEIRYSIADNCTRWRGIFKELSKEGEFLKVSVPYPFNYWSPFDWYDFHPNPSRWPVPLNPKLSSANWRLFLSW
jgi:hypothetical protein